MLVTVSLIFLLHVFIHICSYNLPTLVRIAILLYAAVKHVRDNNLLHLYFTLKKNAKTSTLLHVCKWNFSSCYIIVVPYTFFYDIIYIQNCNIMIIIVSAIPNGLKNKLTVGFPWWFCCYLITLDKFLNKKVVTMYIFKYQS